MITETLYQELKKITEEEQYYLDGKKDIQKTLYMSHNSNMIDAAKILEKGKLIQVRPHTRFVHFPKHTHNYIEVIYMCSGRTRHIVNDTEILLEEGELLFLNQSVTQEIFPAGENDIAVNFIILPEFFYYVLQLIGNEQNLLKELVIDCLTGKNDTVGYMHFKVADILPIQNLVENLIWSIWNKQPNKRSMNQITMGLLFLQLINHMDRMEANEENQDQKLIIDVLGYIEEHYRDGELTELAKMLHYDAYWLSKEIKKQTGKNYTELVQTKRLNQAVYLLENTGMSVLEVGMAVGYDNQSYFHRIFQKRFGMTPKKYRDNNGK